MSDIFFPFTISSSPSGILQQARDGKDLSRGKGFLSASARHTPSMATQLLNRDVPWQVISAIYCLAMGYPSSWNETRLRDMETP